MPKRLSEEFLRSLIGSSYGHLTIIEFLGPKSFSGVKRPCFLVRCRCGAEVERSWNTLSTMNSRSCGCTTTDSSGNPQYVEKHGLTSSSEYLVWQNMIKRCEYEKSDRFENYGSRGISICKEWRNSFSTFLSDMGERPSHKHTIERVDVNADYCKNNCIWVDDPRRQAYNTTLSNSNKSGKSGVRELGNGKWSATIGSRQNRVYLGTFTSFEEAVAAREVAEIEIYGFNKE